MFKKISSSMPFPLWATPGTRWRQLGVLDSLLDGKFYDHLKFCFYDEVDGTDRYVPLAERRPSCQYRLPRYVARWVARKLFAGRHIPKLRAPSKAQEQEINNLLTGTKIWPIMYEAAYRGTVGSVAVTFLLKEGKVALKVWRSQWCSPLFDEFGELKRLRVHYVTTSQELMDLGMTVPDATRLYWFVRDYGSEQEVTYQPVEEHSWNPVAGFKARDGAFVPFEEGTVEHGLGFVPGVWICNPGGALPDGPALWDDAIPDTIEADYLLSQAARGSRYSCAPQLVTQGDLLAPEGDGRGLNPTTVLSFRASYKGEDGVVVGGGDAKLIEMDGKGIDAAAKIVEALKKMALEQIGVVQKDPGEMPGPLSGRAMEYLDEDAHDTAMHWRNVYGDGGALPLICKILKALGSEIDVTKLWFQWPRIYQPTPADLQSIAQALTMAVKPTAIDGSGAAGQAEPGATDTEGNDVAPAMPIIAPLMAIEEAQKYWEANLDLGILDDTAHVGGTSTGEGREPSPADPEGGETKQIGPFWTIHPPVRA